MIIHLLLCALPCFLVLHTVFWWTTLRFVVLKWTIGTVYAHTHSEMNETSRATIELYTPLRQSQPRLPGFALLSVVRIWDVCCIYLKLVLYNNFSSLHFSTPLFSGGGSGGFDPVPHEWSDEAAEKHQSQNPAEHRAQQKDPHAGGRVQEASLG